MDQLVDFDGVGVSLGGVPVLRRLSFRIAPGEILGVNGPNGAGKTTLLRAVATLVPPVEGTGSVLGARLGTAAIFGARREIGMMSHQPAVIPELTLGENLLHATRLSGHDAAKVDAALRVVGLDEVASRRASASSYGMLRRLEAARLLITSPRVLLLDEPFSGLDDEAQDLIGALVERTTTTGGGVLMVSHDGERLAAHCGRLLSLSLGRLVPAA